MGNQALEGHPIRCYRPSLSPSFSPRPPSLASVSPCSSLGSPSWLEPAWGGPPRAACRQRRLTASSGSIRWIYPLDLSVGSIRWRGSYPPVQPVVIGTFYHSSRPWPALRWSRLSTSRGGLPRRRVPGSPEPVLPCLPHPGLLKRLQQPAPAGAAVVSTEHTPRRPRRRVPGSPEPAPPCRLRPCSF